MPEGLGYVFRPAPVFICLNPFYQSKGPQAKSQVTKSSPYFVSAVQNIRLSGLSAEKQAQTEQKPFIRS